LRRRDERDADDDDDDDVVRSDVHGVEESQERRVGEAVVDDESEQRIRQLEWKLDRKFDSQQDK